MRSGKFGWLRSLSAIPPLDRSVYIRGATAQVTASAATSVMIPIPSGAEVGDLLVISLMTRSEPTTPMGYSLYSQSPFFATPSGTRQKNSVYIKTAETSDLSAGSVTLLQSASGRINAHACALASDAGTPVAYSQATDGYDSQKLNTVPIAETTSNDDSTLALAVASSVLALIEEVTVCTVSAGWAFSGLDRGDQLRLYVATKALQLGQVAAGEFVINIKTDDANGASANTLLFRGPI